MTKAILHQIIDIYIRSSSSSDDKCKNNNNSPECQRPTSEDGLTVGLAVGLPAAAIVMVLGFFLLRNYRKNKKEDMEHDPDFDENGEATALPDLLPANAKQGNEKGGYEMEDPFDNRNSVRYPNHDGKPRTSFYQHNVNNSSVSLTPSQRDAYAESIVLPYHHQTGSKLSLDEYAKQLGGYDNTYNGTPRGSSYIPHHGTRNSSLSNINYLPQPSVKSTSVSPQKSMPPVRSNLKYENKDYQTLPNHSLADITDDHDTTHDGHDTTNDIEEVSVSGSENDDKMPGPKFAINYENESDSKINNTLNNKLPSHHDDSTNDTFDTTVEHLGQGHADNSHINNFEPTTAKDITRHDSPFDDDARLPPPNNGVPILENEEAIDGDFDFSNDSANLSAVNTVSNEHDHDQFHDHETANTSTTNLEFDKAVPQGEPESKRINEEPGSKFDDEEFDDIDELNNEETLQVKQRTLDEKPSQHSTIPVKESLEDDHDIKGEGENNFLSAEQEEELKRMKSVYKLYFDRENSVKRKDDKQIDDFEYKPDLTQPLPMVDTNQFLTINKDLVADTDYNKRLTTTSSIYTDVNGVNNSEALQYQQPQPYQYDYNQSPDGGYIANPQQEYQYYSNYLQDPNFQQFYQEHTQNLAPLQHLPHPSDIRKSTIQTYTDFQPRSKNNITSPPMKQPFVPIENDNVWTSPVSTPTSTQAPTFETYQTNNSKITSPPTIPSATQVARSSVVMLNPVTEITKQRKFRPAGSLPSAPHGNNHAYASYAMNSNQPSYQGQRKVTPPQLYQTGGLNSSRDLIPEGKGDVRRLMNDNF